MRFLTNKVSMVIILTGVMLFQLTALELTPILQETISYHEEKSKPNFLKSAIGIGFGEGSHGLVFMVNNDGGQELWLEGLQRNTNGIFFEEKGEYTDSRMFSGPAKYYGIIPTGSYSIEYQLFDTLQSFKRDAWTNPFITVSWIFSALNHKTDIGIDKIYLINSKVNELYDFSSRFDEPNAVNLKIAKVIDDDNGYNFAFIVSNNTSTDITVDDFCGPNTQIKLTFPDDREFTFPGSADAGKVVLPAGKSTYKFFDLKQVLDTNSDYSLDSFKYGISQLTLEVLPSEGEKLSFSLPLVTFHQEPPTEADYGRYRSLVKSPPTKDVFENNAFTLMEVYEQMGDKTRLFRQ